MSVLKSLTFTNVPKTENSPLQRRRSKMIERLEEQKLLLKDPAYVRIVQRWKKKDGERVLTDNRVRVAPWWRTDEKGLIVFSMRVGSKPLEFEKGKAGVLAGSKEKLPDVIDTLITAVRSGELDPMLQQANAIRPAPKKKAA